MTASASTVADLITMVRSDNNRRQQEVDQAGLLGAVPRRTLNVNVLPMKPVPAWDADRSYETVLHRKLPQSRVRASCTTS